MTITNQVTKVSYLGNGATTVFSYNFPIDSGEDQVSLIEIATGTETILNPAAYTITGLGVDAGGTVTYPLSGAALASTYYLVIERVVDYTQETVFGNQDGFYPETLEEALDTLVKQIQQVAQSVANVMQYNVVDPLVTTTLPPAATRALKYLTFDADGNPTVSSALSTGVYPVSAAVGPLLNSASVAVLTAALGALLGISGATSTGSANAQAVAGTGFILTAGSRATFKAGFTNTGATTLNINATGAIAVRKQTTGGLSALRGSEITVGTQVDVEYDGTFYVLLKGTETLLGAMIDVASANTVDLGLTVSHNINLTGSVNILNFGSSALVDAPIYKLTFASNPVITHNAALIICPGAQDIVAAAGDTAEAQYLGAGIWRIRNYQRANASLGAGLPQAVGLSITNNTGTPNTKIDIAADYISGNGYYAAAFTATIDLTTGAAGTSVANGMDGTARVLSSWLSIHVISNGSSFAGLASASATAPVIPTGYKWVGYFGRMRLDISTNLLRTKQLGNEVKYTAAPVTMASGLAGGYSTTAPVWTAIALGNFIPPSAVKVNAIFHTNSAALNSLDLLGAPNNTAYAGIASATPPPVYLPNGSYWKTEVMWIVESTNIYWSTSSPASPGGLVQCLGWVDKVNAV